MRPVRFVAARLAVVSVLAIALGACSGDESATEPAELPECTGTVALRVGPGTTPEFSWQPACRLASVLVEPTQRGLGGDHWSIYSEANTIAPPLRYGVTPQGATLRRDPRSLSAGVQYRVVVRWREGGDERGLAIQAFTP